MIHLLFSLLLLVHSKIESDHEPYAERWASWKLKFQKAYETEEQDLLRMSIFIENLIEIERWNANPSDTYTKAINQFGDLTPSEWKSHISRPVPKWFQDRARETSSIADTILSSTSVADSVDWQTKDCGGGEGSCLTPAKDQGQCGSCWAFSATGAMESLWAEANHELYSLSEQELVDCTRDAPYNNIGCDGGVTDYGFKYAIIKDGLCSEEEYPYRHKDGTCHNCTTRYVPIQGWGGLGKPVGESELKEALNAVTVSGAVEADQVNFQFYHSGVITAACGTALDHGILVVGYGTDEDRGGIDYWKIKNSWGASWGEEGYLRICRGCNANGDAGQCGIYRSLSFPNL